MSSPFLSLRRKCDVSPIKDLFDRLSPWRPPEGPIADRSLSSPIQLALLFLLFTALLLGTDVLAVRAQSYDVESPDGTLTVTVAGGGDQLMYEVERNGTTLVHPSPISVHLKDGAVFGTLPEVVDHTRRTVDRDLTPVVPTKQSTVRDHFRELELDFEKDFALIVRVYNDGTAYRFRSQRTDSLTVEDELATFNLANGHEQGAAPSFYWARNEEAFVTHSESYYQPPLPSDSIPGRMTTAPVMLSYGSDGPRVAVTEADLRDYPGMFLVGDPAEVDASPFLRGTFPGYVLEEAVEGDDERNTYPTKRADEIGRTSGSRTFPWRVLLVADTDVDLLENELVYKLGPERRLEQTDWIQPGKVAWDWYNALNLFGVDFEAGLNTQTYKYYIDFASKHDLEYVILDEGWYELGDLLAVNDDIDVEELVAYAEERDVGLILWMVWKTLDRQMEEALDQFEEWGIRGIKVDFMQRDDQEVVNFYWRTAREAADRELLVNFHGNYKPTGLRRAYPNVITREGVNGLEQNKWSDQLTPQHNVTIPFTRMVPGPMDYTPGAMVNAQPQNFVARFERPMSQGTRAHQLAMYVVYESPMQMLADSPSQYEREPPIMDFLSEVPTIWDETRALQGRVGKFVVMARRRGNTWYLGAMTNEDSRTLEVELSFLETDSSYKMTSWSDGPNARRYAEDYQKRSREVTSGEVVTVDLAPAGGIAARFRPLDTSAN